VNEVALDVRGLTGPRDAPQIFDISLQALRGQTTVVLGPIHSGKSSLMRHLVGLECALSGTIELDGETFDPTTEVEPVVRRMRTRLGAVFEGAALISRISVLENVELPLLEHTNATAEEARNAAQGLLSEVGLSVDETTSPIELDRAAQRLVALARALALRPSVVLLDEPSQGLDPHAAARFDETIDRLQEPAGFAVLIFTREVRYAFGRVERIYVMHDGRIVGSGTHESLQHSEHEIVRRLLERRGPE